MVLIVFNLFLRIIIKYSVWGLENREDDGLRIGINFLGNKECDFSEFVIYKDVFLRWKV